MSKSVGKPLIPHKEFMRLLSLSVGRYGTIEKAAKKLKINRCTIHAWIAQRKKPTYANVCRIIVDNE